MQKTLLNEIKRCILEWDKSDIYVISLFVYDENDNLCQPTVTLGYNTMEQFREEVEFAGDVQEAKWNYAFWIQNSELEFGVDESQEIVKAWVESNGFPYISEEDMFEGEDDIEEEKLEEITEAFINVLIEIVQELHSSGFIREQFGKDIPILIHELEYYDEIAEQNLKANPPELIQDFVRFCRGE